MILSYLLISFIVLCKIHFFLIKTCIYREYTKFLLIQTDWKISFFQEFHVQLKKFFHVDCVLILEKTAPDSAYIISYFGNKEFNSILEKTNPYIKCTFMQFQTKILDQEEIKNYFFQHSFSIPIFLNKKNIEYYILFYYKSNIKMIFAFIKYYLNKTNLCKTFILIFRSLSVIFNKSFEGFTHSVEDQIFIMLDKDSAIISWNKGAEKLFGYRSIEMMGQKFNVLFNDDEKNTWNNVLTMLQVKKIVKFFVMLKDRMSIPIRSEIKITEIKNSSLDIESYIVFVKDITKEEIFKENIQQHSTINYMILENTEDGILILDENDKVIFYNSKITKIIDYSINLFGILGYKIFPNKFSKEFRKKTAELKEKDTVNLDYWFEYKYYDIKFLRILKNSNKEYGGVIVFFKDQTFKKDLLSQLEEKKEFITEMENVVKETEMTANLIKEEFWESENKNSNFNLEVYSSFSNEIGGNFYSYETIEIEDNQYFLFFLSDLNKKGISAFLLNLMIKEVYTEYINTLKLKSKIDGIEFFKILNKKLLVLNRDRDKFITGMFCIFDISNKKISISSAGYYLPYIFHENKVKLLKLKRSIPLGIVEYINSDKLEMDFVKGDRFVFYTSGLLEIFETDKNSHSKTLVKFLEKYIDLSLIELKNAIIEECDLDKNKKIVSKNDISVFMLEIK